MTPRRAGGLTGFVVFAALAGVHAAASSAGNATDAGESAGLLLSAVLAVAAGMLVARIAGSVPGRRAAGLAAGASYLLAGAWTWWRAAGSPRTPAEDSVRYALELVATALTMGTALSLAAATLAWWIARHAVGRDGAERLVALETTGWGAALQAELASIDDPGQRSRFARSAAFFALRPGHWPVRLAALTGLSAGVVVMIAATGSDRRGLLGEPLMGLVIALLVAAAIAGTLIGKSFRAGLETAVLAWLATYLCTLAVEIPQALAWYRDDGVFLFDGEPAARVSELEAALQPITHSAFVFVSISQLVLALLAAAFGAMMLRPGSR